MYQRETYSTCKWCTHELFSEISPTHRDGTKVLRLHNIFSIYLISYIWYLSKFSNKRASQVGTDRPTGEKLKRIPICGGVALGLWNCQAFFTAANHLPFRSPAARFQIPFSIYEIVQLRHHIRPTSHTRLRAGDYYASSTLIGGKVGAGSSSLHTRRWRPRGPKKRGVLHGKLCIRVHGLPEFASGPLLISGPDANPERLWFFNIIIFR